MRRLAGQAQPHSGRPSSAAPRLAPRGLVDAVRVDAAVDPAAAARRAVVLQLGVGRQRLAVGVPAVDLGQHRLGARLVYLALGRVVPGQLAHRPVARLGRAGQPLPDQPAEVVGEPQVAAGVAGRLDRRVVPLQHPVGVGEAAGLLGVRGGREEEHLGPDLLGPQLARLRSPGRPATRSRSRSARSRGRPAIPAWPSRAAASWRSPSRQPGSPRRGSSPGTPRELGSTVS